jgi:hypothetical protein
MIYCIHLCSQYDYSWLTALLPFNNNKSCMEGSYLIYVIYYLDSFVLVAVSLLGKVATLGTQETRRRQTKTRNITQYLLDTIIHKQPQTINNVNKIWALHTWFIVTVFILWKQSDSKQFNQYQRSDQSALASSEQSALTSSHYIVVTKRAISSHFKSLYSSNEANNQLSLQVII